MKGITVTENSLSKSLGSHVYKLNIPLKLHSLNDYIEACRRHPQQGAQMKRIDQTAVEWCIKSQMDGVHIKTPVRMLYRWHEQNKKRDLDNVSSYGRKVIQDALVACDVLHDDGWKQITGFADEFYVDKKRPRIEVIISDAEDCN